MHNYFRYTFLMTISMLSFVYSQSLSLHDFEEEFIKIVQRVRLCVVQVTFSYKTKCGFRESSGVILDTNGHIVTVAGATRNAHQIYVTLNSGEKMEAVLIGKDCQTNLAIIKVKSNNLLEPARKGESDKLRVGAMLIAVGNPYGLNNSVSTGIVSGLNRCVWAKGCDRPLTGLIQTTAPINPGDDGGLVVDSKGEFVGMSFSTLNRDIVSMEHQEFFINFFQILKELQTKNSSQKLDNFFQKFQISKMENHKLAMSSANVFIPQGINFILPSKTVYWVSEQIISHGEVRRGWLGISVKDSDNGAGAIITHIVPQSPAEIGGIKIGDYIVSLNDCAIHNSRSLLEHTYYILSQQTIRLKLLRENQELNISITLLPHPSQK